MTAKAISIKTKEHGLSSWSMLAGAIFDLLDSLL